MPGGVAAARRPLLARLPLARRRLVPGRQLVVRRPRVDQCQEDEDGHG